MLPTRGALRASKTVVYWEMRCLIPSLDAASVVSPAGWTTEVRAIGSRSTGPEGDQCCCGRAGFDAGAVLARLDAHLVAGHREGCVLRGAVDLGCSGDDLLLQDVGVRLEHQGAALGLARLLDHLDLQGWRNPVGGDREGLAFVDEGDGRLETVLGLLLHALLLLRVDLRVRDLHRELQRVGGRGAQSCPKQHLAGRLRTKLVTLGRRLHRHRGSGDCEVTVGGLGLHLGGQTLHRLVEPVLVNPGLPTQALPPSAQASDHPDKRATAAGHQRLLGACSKVYRHPHALG